MITLTLDMTVVPIILETSWAQIADVLVGAQSLTPHTPCLQDSWPPTATDYPISTVSLYHIVSNEIMDQEIAKINGFDKKC